jgi:hypothetical protein
VARISPTVSFEASIFILDAHVSLKQPAQLERTEVNIPYAVVDLLQANVFASFQAQVTHLRNTESNPVNYRAAVSGFLAEIDRMQLEVREYLSLYPSELATSVLLDAAGDAR